MSFEETMEWARTLPIVWLDWRGRPLMTRDEWEQLGRWRRLRDMLLARQPLKE